MTTLRRERRQRFDVVMREYYGEKWDAQTSGFREGLLSALADAAESRTEKQTDEPPAAKPEIDKVAAWLAMSQFPGAQREARTDALLSYFAETLRRTTTSKEWLEFAKWVDNRQQKHGEKAQVFVEWLRGQKNYDPQFWPVSKMMEFWPSAFVSVQSPQRPELEKYTPDDPTQFVPRPK